MVYVYLWVYLCFLRGYFSLIYIKLQKFVVIHAVLLHFQVCGDLCTFRNFLV